MKQFACFLALCCGVFLANWNIFGDNPKIFSTICWAIAILVLLTKFIINLLNY